MLNQIMQAVNRNQANIGGATLGIVASSDPKTGLITVTLQQTQQVTTGWIPYGTAFYGWYSPPVGGEQCLVIYQDSNKQCPVGALLLYWPQNMPPSGVALGEFILRHSSGSYIKAKNNGNIEINTTADVEINSAAGVNITAATDINITSSTTVNVIAPSINLGASAMDALQGIVNQLAVPIFNTHTHNAPGGTTDVPNQLIGSSAITVNTKAT